MKINGRRVLVCNCEGTMNIDGNKLAKACGSNEVLSIASSLCREQIKTFENATLDGKVLVACTQEAPMFMESNDDFADKAADFSRSHQTIKEEESFECIRCSKPFGTKSTIETMKKK